MAAPLYNFTGQYNALRHSNSTGMVDKRNFEYLANAHSRVQWCAWCVWPRDCVAWERVHMTSCMAEGLCGMGACAHDQLYGWGFVWPWERVHMTSCMAEGLCGPGSVCTWPAVWLRVCVAMGACAHDQLYGWGFVWPWERVHFTSCMAEGLCLHWLCWSVQANVRRPLCFCKCCIERMKQFDSVTWLQLPIIRRKWTIGRRQRQQLVFLPRPTIARRATSFASQWPLSSVALWRVSNRGPKHSDVWYKHAQWVSFCVITYRRNSKFKKLRLGNI